ncbi:hypothetical protein FOL47_000183 [Perkinsus chesapeaki]|uniref:Amidase domain-containing protein n=1 Tax=Perkinsus chesapeaki TaxID=330153 RepID=A0A7J6KXY4_PERCH|nr:hypothetical protein FOL47_000183 [Perkinsus chesapeaki]
MSRLLALLALPLSVSGFGVECDILDNDKFNIKDGKYDYYDGLALKVNSFFLSKGISFLPRLDAIYKFGNVTRFFGPEGKRTYTSIEDLHRAYLSRASDPVTVIKGVLQAAMKLNVDVHAIEKLLPSAEVLSMAEKSAARFREGKPLSMLDGVPFVVKNDVNVKGISTLAGMSATSKVGKAIKPAAENDRVVARLLDSGAILIGVAAQSELGLSPTGFSEWKKGPLNPHRLNRFTGGSTSGVAAAVSMGLVPFGVGTDGNGCNRIPASLTGVVGMAPTYGRVRFDAPTASAFKNVHYGPIAGNVEDVAHVMSVIADGKENHEYDTYYHMHYRQGFLPKMHLRAFTHPSNEVVKVGIFTKWADSCSKDVIKVFYDTVHKYPGWKVDHFTVPQMAGQLKTQIISLLGEYGNLLSEGSLSHLEYSSKIMVGLARTVAGSKSKKKAVSSIRGWAMAKWEAVFKKVDFIVVPTVREVAPKIPGKYFDHRPFDPAFEEMFVRSTWVTNLLGYPSISVSMGMSKEGFPMGLQVIGKHWEDDKLMKVASQFQQYTEPTRAKPTMYNHELI